MLLTAALILVIAYLPGAVIFRLPIADRPRRAALPADERLFWAVIISVIISTTAALAFSAMAEYTIERLAIFNVILTIGLAIISAGNLRLRRAHADWTAAFPAALIATGVWMYFAAPASEYVLGGRDPGVYMSEGIQIAQRRSLTTIDTVASAVPAASRDLFFPSYGDPSYYSVRYMGFQLRDPEAGTVSGQFPHGYPVWIAIAYGLDGVSGTRRVTAWWAILGVLAVYFAGRRLIGPVPAAAAAALLCVHVVQTWYARWPGSEIVTQPLLFSAFLAHSYAHEDDDPFFGPVAASLLGVALFTRLPVVLVVGIATAASLLAPVGGHRTRAGFLVTLAIWLAAAGLYYTTQLLPYFGRPIQYFQFLKAIHLMALGAGLAAVCAWLWAIRKPAVAAATRVWLPRALIAVVVIGGVYALYFREPVGLLAPQDAHAVRMFADLYFTRIAFGLALAGYALVVWRSFWRAPALILAITMLSLFFFYKMRVFPEHFWLARRYLTEILPGALIFAAAAMFAPVWMGKAKSQHAGSDPRDIKGVRPLLWAVGMLGVIVLGRHYLVASEPIRTHVEYAGLIPKIEQLAAGFGDNDLVLVDSREASDSHALALPLSYIYARNVLVLANSRPDKASFARFFAWALEHYKNIYLIAGGGTDLLSPGIASTVVSNESFQIPEYERTPYSVHPHLTRLKPFDFTIYRIVKSDVDATVYSLDIGGADDLHLLDFLPKERLDDRTVTFRWTKDRSRLLLGVRDSSRESGSPPQQWPPSWSRAPAHFGPHWQP